MQGRPIFESKYNTKLDPQDYLKSRGTHFDRASKALHNDIMNDSNLRSKFTEAEIAYLKREVFLKHIHGIIIKMKE